MVWNDKIFSSHRMEISPDYVCLAFFEVNNIFVYFLNSQAFYQAISLILWFLKNFYSGSVAE